jgi:hypothetical protein
MGIIMNGQAQAPESGDLNDLASFLDQPEEESTEENEVETAEESASDETTEETANDDSDELDESDDESDDDATPVEKITIKVKGEDGEEEIVEATPEELVASYMRRKDYTKKTQALAMRENEAVQFLTEKHEEIRQNYISQAELTRAAIVNMAGLKSESEMATLAHEDPAAWVAENQRQIQIGNYLNQLDQAIHREKSHAEQQSIIAEQSRKEQLFNNTWSVLQKEGIDRPKLENIYSTVVKNYGFTQDELATVLDHRMVQVMRDAVAYRALKAQKANVTKKVQDAPRMPTRQSQPANERRDRELDAKFKSGKAKLNDLAAYLR